jgi:hypothetical protein
MRFHFNWFLVLALAACPAAWAQQEGETKPDKAAQAAETQDDEKELTVAEKFRAIQGAQRKMMMDLGNEFRDAKGDQAAQAEIMQQRVKIEQKLAQEALALVKESDDDDLSVQILVFVSNFPGETQAKATDLLMNKYITSPAMGMLASRLARQQPGPKTENMLRAIIEKNKDPEVQGLATMALASYLGGSMTKIAAMDDQMKEQVAASMGEGGTAYLKKWTTKAIEAARIKLLETCVEKYGDISMGRRTIGQTAEGQLFVLKYLQIGKVAPDIEGSDLDEVAFKLSDYRGKVVVLDFWGDW